MSNFEESKHLRIQGGRQGPPWGPNSFIFMQFSANKLQNNRLAHPLGSWLASPQELVSARKCEYFNPRHNPSRHSHVCLTNFDWFWCGFFLYLTYLLWIPIGVFKGAATSAISVMLTASRMAMKPGYLTDQKAVNFFTPVLFSFYIPANLLWVRMPLLLVNLSLFLNWIHQR